MRAAILASISAVLLLAGCGKPLPTGTFRGERDLEARPGADPVVVAQARRVVLKIEATGKADLEDGGFPWEGRVSRSGDTLVFEVDAVNGINIAKQPPDIPREFKFEVLGANALSFDGVRLERP